MPRHADLADGGLFLSPDRYYTSFEEKDDLSAGRRDRRSRSGSRQLSNPDELRLPDPSGLEPIEGHLWTPGGVVPYETTEIIRGSPLSAAKFLDHAVRQARRYSYAGQNMVSVSVNLVLPDWPAERILEERLSTYPAGGVVRSAC